MMDEESAIQPPRPNQPDPVDSLELTAKQVLAQVAALRGQPPPPSAAAPRAALVHRSSLANLPPPALGADRLPTARQVRREGRVFRKQGQQNKQVQKAVATEAVRLPKQAKTTEWLRSRTNVLLAAAATPKDLQESLRSLGAQTAVTRTSAGTTVEVTHPSDPDLGVTVHSPKFPGAVDRRLSEIRPTAPPGPTTPPGASPAPHEHDQTEQRDR